MMSKAGNLLNRSAAHLLHRACQRATDIFADEAQKSGLTPRQYVVLTAVSHQEGLTQAELSGLLLAQGVNNDLVEQVRTCLTISEMGQYAPTHQMNPKEVHLETKSLIAELEKVL